MDNKWSDGWEAPDEDNPSVIEIKNREYNKAVEDCIDVLEDLNYPVINDFIYTIRQKLRKLKK